MSRGNEKRTCCWCKQEMHISAKGLSWHQKRCAANPNPLPPEPPKQAPKWTCPACGKTITEARKQGHRCPPPKQSAVRQGKFEAAIETMKKNDRRREQKQRPGPVQCPRCHATPCATPDACGRWLRANAQHAERLRREAEQLGRRPTD